MYFKKARDIVEPKVSVSNTSYFIALFQIYTDLLRTYETIGQMDSLYTELHKVEAIVKPLGESNNEQFSIYQAFIFIDLGKYNLVAGKYTISEGYLTKAYQYYTNNFSQVQTDKSKFYTCISSLNQCYIQLGRVNDAIHFNHELKTAIKRLAETNPLIFEDFIPQVYGQLSDDYATLLSGDSAVYYSKKAMDLSAAKALQYPLLYYTQYFELSYKAYAILLGNSQWERADSLTAQYVTSWENIYRVSTVSKDLLRSTTAESIGRLAYLFQQSGNVASVPLASRKYLFTLADKYFERADQHFS